MRSKKGFTLAEILGVVVIIGLVTLIVAPTLINNLRKTSVDAEDTGYKVVYNAALNYVNEKYHVEGQYCVPIKRLVAEGKLVSPVVNVTTKKNIEDKVVLVYINPQYGQTYFDMFDNEEDCSKAAKTDPIYIEVDPKMKEWVRGVNGRKVIITYPEGGTNPTYIADNGEEKIAKLDSNRQMTVVYHNNRTMKASIKVGKIKKTRRLTITNIDTTEPRITKLNPDKITTYSNTIKVTATIEDKESGLKSGQSIQYGWSTSKTKAPSSYNTAALKYSSDSKTATATLTATNNLSGTYYLWIKSGIEDKVGNPSVNYQSANAYWIDNVKPTCSVTTAAKDSLYRVDATINCSDKTPGSGVKTCAGANSTRTTKTMPEPTVEYTVKDKANNSNTCKITAKNGFFNSGSCRYYWTGTSRAKGWRQINSSWYYFDNNGCLKTGWIRDTSSKCPSRYYYANSNGVMQTGWKQINGNWYYLSQKNDSEPEGCMMTGWKQINGKWYYLGSDGKRQTGWIRDTSSGCPSGYYYANSNGVMQTGWKQINGNWYYLAKRNGTEARWQSAVPKGCMMTGWVYSHDYSCSTGGWYFYGNGALATDRVIGNDYVNSNGCWTHTWSSCARIMVDCSYGCDTCGSWNCQGAYSGGGYYCQNGTYINGSCSRVVSRCVYCGGSCTVWPGQGQNNGAAFVCVESPSYSQGTWDSCASSYYSTYSCNCSSCYYRSEYCQAGWVSAG